MSTPSGPKGKRHGVSESFFPPEGPADPPQVPSEERSGTREHKSLLPSVQSEIEPGIEGDINASPHPENAAKDTNEIENPEEIKRDDAKGAVLMLEKEIIRENTKTKDADARARSELTVEHKSLLPSVQSEIEPRIEGDINASPHPENAANSEEIKRDDAKGAVLMPEKGIIRENTGTKDAGARARSELTVEQDDGAPPMEETLARLKVDEMRLRAILAGRPTVFQSYSASKLALLLASGLGLITVVSVVVFYRGEPRAYTSTTMLFTVLLLITVPLLDLWMFRKRRQRLQEYVALATLVHARVQNLIQEAEQYLMDREARDAVR